MGITNDTIFWFSKTEQYTFNPIYTKDDEHTQEYIRQRFVYTEEGTGRKFMKSPLVNSLFRPNLKYVFHGVNPPNNGWLYSYERMEEMYNNNELVMPESSNARIYRKIYEDTYQGQLIQNIWTDIPIVNPMAKERVEGFTTQKPSALIERIIQLGSNSNDLVIDFFAGSGTTAYAIAKLNKEIQSNRKYILIEMGDYFDDLLINRVKKSYADHQIMKGSFKYMRLESFEDTLNNLELQRDEFQEIALRENTHIREQYLLSYMLEIESQGSSSLLNLDQFEDPFNYKLNVYRNGESQPVNVDMVETFNYLLGLKVQQTEFIRGFKVVRGELLNGEKVLIIWRNLKEKSNEELDNFFTKQDYNTRDFDFDRIYVNGDNNLPNIKTGEERWKVYLIEQEFKRLMFDVSDI